MKKAMRIFLMIILCSAMTVPSLRAQNNDVLPKKMTKQERKELRLKESLASRERILQLLKQRLFVLEAYQIYGRNGITIPVNSAVNFMAIKGDKIIFQFGLEGGAVGSNGVGGITAEGFIDNYTFNPGKSTKKAMIVTGEIRPKGAGALGRFTLTVGNEGNAFLTMLLPYGGSLNMNGHIVDFAHSSVFKGQTMF
ncbi:MAG: DUF4251 domain-containing protein [Bacteroidales bacterium]|nr:DUF4251 domain-containing protein [Bacteroidales bacterium]